MSNPKSAESPSTSPLSRKLLNYCDTNQNSPKENSASIPETASEAAPNTYLQLPLVIPPKPRRRHSWFSG